jgi:PAS domain S-box-containing protein
MIRSAHVSGDGEFGAAVPTAVQGLPGDRGINGLAIAQRRAVISGDYATDDRFAHVDDSDDFVRRTRIHSVVAAPLFTDDGLLGVVKVGTTARDAYDAEDAALMEAFVAQAVIAIQNAHLIEELGRSREEISQRADAERSVREIAANISAIRDPDAVLQQTVDEARRLLDSDTARIDMIEDGALHWTFASGEAAIATKAAGADTIVPIGDGVTGTAVREGHAFVTGDYLADPRFRHRGASDQLVDSLGLRSVLAAPLRGESGPLGALTVSSRRTDAYNEAQAELLQALADQAAITIQNARLIAELNRSRSELRRRADAERTLREIGARLTAITEPGPLLQQVVDEARRLVGADGSVLDLIDTDATLLRWAYDSGVRSGFTDDEIAQLTIPIGIGATGIAVAEGRVIAADDMLAVHFPESEINDHFFDVTGFRSMIIAPITGESGPLGALEVYSRAPGAFGEDDAALIRALADQAAIALTNSKLYELLGNSEARYRHLVQNSPDLVWSIDADARFTFVSDTCERLTGWRPDELLGKHFGALVHESSGDVAEIDWTTGITREFQELRGRLNLLHRDGHPIPAEFSAFGTLDGEGRFAGANGSVRDMSERDRLERELRESEERYRFLVENAPDIIFSIDTDGRLLYISESVRRALGYDPDQLVGRPFRDIVAYDEPGEPGKRFNEMREDPSLEITSDLQLIHRDGRRIPFEVSSRGVVRGGEFAGIHGSARDISERNRLERELRESEERYRFLVENSPDVVFATDVDGNFTYLSETIERMTGRSPAELVGGHFSRIVHDASLPTALERWSNLESEPNKEQIARINLLHRDGRLVPVEVSAIGTTIDGRFVGIHGATRDISERERLEQDLRRQAGELASSQERAHLARELHDSVTQALFSMTLVTRTTEILVDRDSAAAKEQLASLRDLQREALAEMRALIFELRPGNIEQDGLIPALRTHAAALQGRIGLPILVTSELTERLPLPIEEVLYRISQEALHNVVKHAGARQVTLAIERTTGAVRLRIADDGKGFDSAQVPDGHLGLAGMRARADKIGAEFSVSSRPAAGTTIEVSVPEVIIAAASSAE